MTVTEKKKILKGIIKIIYKLLSIFVYLKEFVISKLLVILIIKVIIKLTKRFKWSLILEKIILVLIKYFLI